MAFSSYTPLQSYPADGVQTDFNAPDLFYDPADVRCVVVDDGNEIPKVQGVDYTVILTGRELTPPFRNTGLVRFVVPPADGVNVVPFILPASVQDQPFEGRPVTPRQHERVHDRAVQTAAMLLAFFDRSYRSPLDTAPGLRFIAAGREGYVPTWDENGNLVEGPTVGQINLVVDIIPEINAVAAITAQVVAVAAIDDEIAALYPVVASIGALGPVAGSIPTLAAVVDEIAILAPIADAIETVASAAGATSTVAANIDDVVVVADDIAAVLLAANNMAAILDAPNQAEAAADSAAEALLSENRVAMAAVPLGTVLMQNGEVDDGYLRVGEGGTYDRAVLTDFAAWMDANGETAFGLTPTQIANGELPEWRDYSPRTAGGTLGPGVGVKQEDAFQNHSVRFGLGGTAIGQTLGNNVDDAWPVVWGQSNGNGQNAGGSSARGFSLIAAGTAGTPRTANETRVKSFGVRWQIKAYGAFVNQGTADLVGIEQAQQHMVRSDPQVLSATQREQVRVNIRDRFVSAAQPIVSGGLLTIAHGLARAPELDELFAYAICTTANSPWLLGDKVALPTGPHAGASNQGMQVWADATNIYVRMGSDTAAFRVINKTNGASASLTNAQWQLYVGAKL